MIVPSRAKRVEVFAKLVFISNLDHLSEIGSRLLGAGRFGDQAIEDAILDSSEAHQKQMMKLLTMPELGKTFANIIYEMLQRDT